ncbi:MAG: NAD-dependent epimerase [Gemmatimonas sp. SG8_38_2]|nr:MAG: NAD-dependent epimerase [Gemmatimonas sp. SG8_38_2]
MRPESNYRGKKVLVTGGLGFIGSTLAIRLVNLGAEVTVLDALVPEHGGNFFNIEPVKDHVAVNVSNMRDLYSLNILVQGKDYIFHLAGQVSHGDSMRDPHLDLGVNCISTMNLVEACRYHNPDARMVYTSTRQVYGRPRELPVTEDHPTIPIDVNGINKLAGEYYHLLYDRTYGIRSCVLRLTNTYGPRQQIRNNRQGFIGIMIRQALSGERIRLFGTGRQVRDFNYVDDVVEALLLAGSTEECHGQLYNLGAPTRHSLIDFVEILGRLLDVNYEIVPFPDDKKIIDIGDYYGDYSRFADATGWQPRVELEEGLRKAIAYYKEHSKVYWK